MADVRCVDGSVLQVQPAPVVDRDGVAYEVTLRLLRDGEPFGEVGERCGYFLASTAARLRAARSLSAQAFAQGSIEVGLRAWARDEGREVDTTWAALQRYLPRDRELFAFRSRDPDDLTAVGELQVLLEVHKRWVAGRDGAVGRWDLRPVADLRAWGSAGLGVRAVLTSDELAGFLDTLVADFAAVGALYGPGEDASPLSRPVG